jgi:hypothetical protein
MQTASVMGRIVTLASRGRSSLLCDTQHRHSRSKLIEALPACALGSGLRLDHDGSIVHTQKALCLIEIPFGRGMHTFELLIV